MVDAFGLGLAGALEQQAARRADRRADRELNLRERVVTAEEQRAEEAQRQKLRERVTSSIDGIVGEAVKAQKAGLLTPDLRQLFLAEIQRIETVAVDLPGLNLIGDGSQRLEFALAGALSPEQAATAQIGAQGAQRDALVAQGVAPDDATQTAFGIQQAPLSTDEEVARASRIAAAQARARLAVEGPSFQTDVGKLISDREKAARLYGEDSAQVAALDEAIRSEEVGEEASLSDVRGVRQEFTKLSGNFISIRDSFQTVQAAADNPDAVGDVSLIFAYMKILDPISVVREGEQATAEQARGVPESILNIYNRAVTGEKLTPQQRQSFVDRAGDLFRVRQQEQQRLEAQFIDLATGLGIDPNLVVIDFGADLAIPERQSAAPESTDLSAVQISGKPVTLMTEEEISQIDINAPNVTPEQRKALLARLEELENGQ